MASAGVTVGTGGGPPGEARPSKPRIAAFDSIRFFLIAYITCGHFINFADPTVFVRRCMAQINVVVGAFFVLSGYVSAYTSTLNAQRGSDAKLVGTPKAKWVLQRVFGYYPLHLFVLALFFPVFVFADLSYGGLGSAVWSALLSLSMTSAWFPLHAEIWNAPTWFLSALTFSTTVLPFALPVLAEQGKKHLRQSLWGLALCGLIPRVAYCYDLGAWALFEGTLGARQLANLAVFNTQRFSPFHALIEVLLGAAACRLVMLDGAPGEEAAPRGSRLSAFGPLVGMLSVLYFRASGALNLSDFLTRSLLFIPLFIRFLMSIHRSSVSERMSDPLARLLSTDLLVFLGGLAFPIFVVHGPIGQIFYKGVVAKALFGGPMHRLAGPGFFYAYLSIVACSAWLLQQYFLKSKRVLDWSKSVVDTVSSWF